MSKDTDKSSANFASHRDSCLGFVFSSYGLALKSSTKLIKLKNRRTPCERVRRIINFLWDAIGLNRIPWFLDLINLVEDLRAKLWLIRVKPRQIVSVRGKAENKKKREQTAYISFFFLMRARKKNFSNLYTLITLLLIKLHWPYCDTMPRRPLSFFVHMREAGLGVGLQKAMKIFFTDKGTKSYWTKLLILSKFFLLGKCLKKESLMCGKIFFFLLVVDSSGTI